MAEIVTLQLPEAVARRARAIAQNTGRPVEAVLTEWLEREAEADRASLLIPGTAYPVFTAYGNEAGAQVLLDAFNAAEARDGKPDQRS